MLSYSELEKNVTQGHLRKFMGNGIKRGIYYGVKKF